MGMVVRKGLYAACTDWRTTFSTSPHLQVCVNMLFALVQSSYQTGFSRQERRISIGGAALRWLGTLDFVVRKGLCAACTDWRSTFSTSPHLQLCVNMLFALVQSSYQTGFSRQERRISIGGATLRWLGTLDLVVRKGLYAACTDWRSTFSTSPHLQLCVNMLFALVQSSYQTGFSRQERRISIGGATLRWLGTLDLVVRKGLYAACTDWRSTFSTSPHLQLCVNMLFALVQSSYQTGFSLQERRISIGGAALRWLGTLDLVVRKGLCAACTDWRSTFSTSPHLQLCVNMLFALVQSSYQTGFSRQERRISIGGAALRWLGTLDLVARKGLYTVSTYWRTTFSTSPHLQLCVNMLFALVQSSYQTGFSLQERRISIGGAALRWLGTLDFVVRKGLFAACTDWRSTFSTSPHLQLCVNMLFALVQSSYQTGFSRQERRISIGGAALRWLGTLHLVARKGLYTVSTFWRTTFSTSPHLQLCVNMLFALVQSSYQTGFSRQERRISIGGAALRWLGTLDLVVRKGLCAACTDWRSTFSTSPHLQLCVNMLFALVQSSYQTGFSRQERRISIGGATLRWLGTLDLVVRKGLYAACTDWRSTFSTSPHLQLCVNMLFALVQSSTRRDLAFKNAEFPLAAQHCGGWERWILWSVRACALLAPTDEARFRPLHTFSFVLICFLR